MDSKVDFEEEQVIEFELPLVFPVKKGASTMMLVGCVFFAAIAWFGWMMWQDERNVFMLIVGIVMALLSPVLLAIGLHVKFRPQQWMLHITEEAIIFPAFWGSRTRRWDQMHNVAPIQIANQIGLGFCNPGSSLQRMMSVNLWSDDPLELCHFLAQVHAMQTQPQQ